jgi:hypothetical protein
MMFVDQLVGQTPLDTTIPHGSFHPPARTPAMQHAAAPCADRENSPLFPLLRSLWLGLLAVSAAHVRIAFDSPWAALTCHDQP